MRSSRSKLTEKNTKIRTKYFTRMRLTVVASFIVIALTSSAAFSSVAAAGALSDFLFGGASFFNLLSGKIVAVQPSNSAQSNSFFKEEPTANVARSGHTATDLGNGRVLLVGGDRAGTAEIFDMNSGTSSLTGSLTVSRTGHTATLLSDGRVLIAGGFNNEKALASTEIYDSGAFLPGPNLNAARAGHTATVLSDGRILFVGGDTKGSIEIFDAAAKKTQRIKSSLITSRSFHSAKMLRNGDVLIVGGLSKDGDAIQSGEILNLETMTFSEVNRFLHSPRIRPILRELPDGKVQIIGGNDEGSMEMFTPDGNYFSAFAHVIPNRNPLESSAFKKRDAKGQIHNVAEETETTGAESEVLKTATRAALINNGEAADSLLNRSDYSLVQIRGTNKVLVTGGKNSAGESLKTSMTFAESDATVTTDKLDYPPGAVVTITGTGWDLGETVKLTIVRDRVPTGDDQTDTIILEAVADAEGNIVNREYTTTEEDLGASFVLTAVGQTSGKTAQTAFTDASSDPTPQAIPYSQDFTGLAHNSNLYPAGWQGWKLDTSSSTSFRINSPTDNEGLQANRQASNPNTGVRNYNGKIGILAGGSGTTDPSLVLAVNTTGLSSINITFDIMTIRNPYDGSGNTRINQIDIQYRVCPALPTVCTGNFTSVSGNANGIYQNNTTNQTSGTTPQNSVNQNFTLPAAANNKPNVQIRWVQRDQPSQAGSRPSFAVDNINVTSAPSCTAPSIMTNPSNQITTYGGGDVQFTAAASGNPAPTVQWEVSTNGGGSWNPIGGATGTTLTVANPTVAMSGNQYRAVFTNNCGGTATATTNAATLTVNQKTVTGSFTADNKVYDGNSTAAILTRAITPADIVGSDVVTLTGGSASFNNKNVGIGKTVTGTGFTLGGANAGNYVLGTVATTTANITAATVTGSFTADNKIYDATAAAAILTRSINSGIVGSEVVTLEGGTASFNDKNVGTNKTVTGTGFTLGGADAGNYQLGSVATTTANITPKNLTINGAVADNKVYDGTATATVNFGGATLVGVIAPDAVTINSSGYTANFDNKNVGTGKPVSIASVALSGADASNYTVSQPGGLSADITAKNLTISGAVANNKVYDGSTAATVNFAGASLSGVIMPDAVSINSSAYTASFDTKNVGTGKPVTVSGVGLAGADAGNYTVSQPNGLTADITPATVTGSFTANNKTYDGTTAAAIATRSITGGIVGSEDVTLTGGTATFDNKNVGTGKTVTGTGFTLGGTDAGNYILGTVAVATADITPKSVTAAVTASHKEYDGNTNATITGCSLSGVVNPDTTGCAASSTAADNQFDNKTVGNGKTVTANNISLTDNSLGNYALTSTTAQTTANITAKALTATVTAGNKEYDGNQNAVITACSFAGAVAGDDINCVITGYSASFNTKNVGTGKAVIATGLSKDGGDADNYTFGGTGTGTADITPKALTATVTANNKSYDGNAVATIGGCSLTGVVSGDSVSCETGGYSASFNDKNVGMNKPVTVSGLGIGGDDAGNYSFGGSGSGSANIAPIALTATVAASNKQYDGNAAATITGCSFSGAISGDSVNCEITGYTASFNNSSVGIGKPVTASGLNKSGTDAGNYTFDGTGTGSADITAKALTATVTANNKPYDGNAVAVITACEFTGVVSGDTVNCEITGYSASFDNPNSGTGKTVTANGLSKSGGSAGNYSFEGTGTGLADITAKLVTASVTASSKIYDGNANATITNCSLSGVVNPDTTGCAASSTAADNQFNNKTVGNGKTVTANNISLTANAAGNYALSSTTANTTANITELHITGSFTADNKEYDGNTSAVVLTRLLNGAVGGDDVSLNGGTAAFDNENVGTGKTVTLTGANLAGADAGNYILDSVSTTTANITVKALTATVAAGNKPYDGNANATISSCTFSGVVNGDDVSCETAGYTASFNNKNVGMGKTVTAGGLSKSGADAGNYSFNGSGTGSADITATSLTATVNANSKIYDGTADAAISSCSFTGVINGDTVNCVTNGYSASFDNQNVGTGKPVNAAGLSKSGADAGNYTFDGTGTGSANITHKNATWTTNPNYKYFGQPDPNPLTTGSPSGFIPADGVTAAYSRAAGSNAGPHQITATLSSAVSGALNNYSITNNGAIFTIKPDPTEIALDANNDGINFDCINNTYKATLKDTITNQGVSGVTLKMTIGSQSTTAVTNGSGEATFTLVLSQTPGMVTQKVEVDPSFTWSNTNLAAPALVQRSTFVISGSPTVGPGQDADSLYTGSLWFWTTSSTSSTATLTLSATIKDTFEYCPGDITKAKVSFLISTNGGTSFSPVSGAQNLPVGLVNPNDTTTGTASAVSQYNIGSSQSVTLIVRVVVGGQYALSTAMYDVPVSIGKPGQANSLMGGGKLRNDGIPYPANGYLGANSVKSEFGTQVTYNRSGTNPKGDVTVTITTCNKPDGSVVEGCTKYTPSKWRTYFVKSNAISELSLISGSASFGSKTNVSEVLPDGSKVGLDGGNLMQLVFTPQGKPFPQGMAAAANGSTCQNASGCASIVIYRSNGLGGGVWYSSAWGQYATASAPRTYLKNVVGGNVTVQ